MRALLRTAALPLALLVSTAPATQEAPELVIESGHPSWMKAVALSHDDRTLLSFDMEATMKVWDFPHRRQLGTRNHMLAGWPLSVERVLFTPDDTRVVLQGYRGLLLLDCTNFAVVASREVQDIRGMVLARDGKTLFTLEAPEHAPEVALVAYGLPKLEPREIVRLPRPGERLSLDIAPDGERLLVEFRTEEERKTVASLVLSAQDGRTLLELPAEVAAVAFTPEGKLLGLEETRGWCSLRLIDAADGSVLRSAGYSAGELAVFQDFGAILGWQPGGRLGALGTSEGVFLFDRTTLEELGRAPLPQPFFQRFSCSFTRDGNWLVTVGERLPHFYDLRAEVESEQDLDTPAMLEEVSWAAKTGTLGFHELFRADALVRLDPDALRPFVLTDVSESESVLAPDGSWFATWDQYAGNLHVFQPVEPVSSSRSLHVSADDGEQKRLFPSAGGGRVAVASSKQAHVLDIASGEVLLSTSVSDAEIDATGCAALSTDEERLLLVDHDPPRAARCFALTDGTTLWEQPFIRQVFGESDDVFLCMSNDGEIVRLDSRTGGELSRHGLFVPGVNGSIGDVLASPDGKTAICQDSSAEGFAVVDVEQGRLRGRLAGGGKIYGGTFLDARRAVTIGGDHALRFWDVEECKLLARLVTFTKSEEWVVVAPDGRFDASPGGLAKLYFARGRTIIPVESLYERFFTPHLLQRLLAGEEFEPVRVDFERLKDPPTVSIRVVPNDAAEKDAVNPDEQGRIVTTKATLRLSVEGRSLDDTIDELRLYHNDKLLDSAVRNLTVEEDAPVGDQRSQTFEVALVAGENRFRAVALNSERTESLPAELVVEQRPGSSGPAASGIDLHLVVVGINAYKNPKYSLNYARADAQGVVAALTGGTEDLFAARHEHILTDAEADKASIVRALEEVASSARPADVLVFYYAGHGVMSEGAEKDFYLVPFDVTQLYGNAEALAEKGLSTRELQEFSKRIPAQKQLFVLDACQSAGALTTVAARGAAEERAIAQLARSTGTHWLTASGSDQFASEFAELGHGSFTYVLLEALGGAADSGDGRVTVNELKAFLESQVPEITQKYRGAPQYPASFGFGQDFPIGMVGH